MKQKSGDFLSYKGLFGENKSVILPDFIHVEPLETRSRSYDWEIKEHLHTDLYQLFLLTKGGGKLFSETRIEALSTPCLAMIPSNTLHGFSFEENSQGTVITLSESYLYNILQQHQEVVHYLQKLHVTSLRKSSSNLNTLEYLVNLLAEELLEYEGDNVGLKPLLELLFITIFRNAKTNEDASFGRHNPSLRIFNSFQKEIRKTIRETKTVSTYSQNLGISAVHLNRVCQQIAQKTAISLIHEKLIDEAKRYLLNTEYSVSEVAYLFNFNDPAHFTKLFKKYVGVSPSEFRKS